MARVIRQSPLDRQIASRRKADALEDRMVQIAENKTGLLRADWETKTHARIEARVAAQERQRQEEEKSIQLRQRRDKLKRLYDEECASWISEMQQPQETPAQRRDRLRAQAVALRDRREAERKAFAEAKRNQQWRDACDEARTLDSLALLEYVSRERKKEVDFNEKKKELDKVEAAKFAEQWRASMKVLEDREAADAEDRHAANMACKEDLDEQVRIKNQRRLDLISRMENEAKQELDELAAAKKKDQDEQDRRRREAHLRGQEVKEFNKEREDLREKQAEIQRKQDLLLLRYALDQEREQVEAEKSKRQAEAKAMRDYRDHLRELMVKEAEDDSEIDKVRKADEDRVWDKRDQQLRAREEARRRLMEIVHVGRQEQIKAKQKREAEERALEKEQERNDALDHKRGVERDLEASAKRKKDCMNNNRLLLEQMASREKARLEEKERERREAEQWKADMKALDERATLQAGEVKLFYPKQHTQWYS